MDARQDDLGFLSGAGDLGRLIAAFDWAGTRLGPIRAWPEGLRVATGMILRSPLAMVLLWGRDGIMIYNEPYARIAAGRHPGILGGRAVDAFPEIAAFNRHVIDVGLAGGTLSFKDQRFTLFRNGWAEDVWLDLTYSPVLDATGRPAGVLAVVVETTARVLADERSRIAQAAGGFGAFEWFPEQRRLVVSDVFRELYGLPPDQEPTDDALMELIVPDDRDQSGKRRYGGPGNPLAYAEYRVRHPVTGAIRWIARRGEILEGGAGQGGGGSGRRFLGVAWDITERKHAESQAAFLAALSDRLRDIADAREVVAVAAESLGRHLGVGRVGYAEIEPDGIHATVERDWTDGRMPCLAGRHAIAAFGPAIVRRLAAAAVVRIDDTWTDPDLADPVVASSFAAIGMRAGITVPLARDGRFVGVLYAHSAEPRRWEDHEEAVVRAVAARTWDAAQRARAEQRLRESEETFRGFAQAMPNQVWAADPAGRLNWFNDRVYAYFGAGPGDLDGDAWIGVVHPQDQATALAAWRTALRDGGTYEIAFRLRRADGAHRWHIARAVPIRGGDGAITRWIGTNTDIQEQRQALADLARLNTTLEERVAERTRERDRIWALSRDALLIADREGRWLSVSPAWTSLLGWSQSDLVGRSAGWMGHPDDPPLDLTAIGDDAGGGPTPRAESRFRARDGGYRWFSWTAVADGDLLYCVARDVTAEKDAAARLRQIEEALRQSQKMEAIGQLTGGIAHDFNNLLTGIMGSLALVRRRVATGRLDDIDRFIEAATASAQRAAALTHRLLAFARRQSLDTRPVPVDGLVRGMEDLLRRTLGEQVNLQIALAPDGWPAMTDANQLESAILNLAINARDAMPGGGELTIETANTVLDARYTQMHQDLRPGDFVAISVTDTGIGMSKAVIEKAFEPFFTTKPVGQGTGLGLSMVYGFTRQSGGHARIYSEPGRGTTVTLYLPRAVEEAAAGTPGPADAPAGRGEIVLVVEDDPAVRMLIIEVLRELGYQASEATDASQALDIIGSGQPIDLMVSDVGLPGLNGRQLADFARERRPDLKVLFVTGYAENAAIRSGFLASGMDMITKPFAIEALASKISAMMART
jgi:PAS domain S-box-containing protein